MDDWSMFPEGETDALVWIAGKTVLRMSIGSCHQFVRSQPIDLDTPIIAVTRISIRPVELVLIPMAHQLSHA